MNNAINLQKDDRFEELVMLSLDDGWTDYSDLPDVPRAKGVAGMKAADKILKQYQTVGMLIGGLAKEIWSGGSKKDFKKHKDVDVLLFSFNCKHHPLESEGDIDWWLRHQEDERPNNGGASGLVWRVSLKRKHNLTPGLYLCPKELLQQAIEIERTYVDAERYFSLIEEDQSKVFNTYPVLDPALLKVKWFTKGENDELACLCEPPWS